MPALAVDVSSEIDRPVRDSALQSTAGPRLRELLKEKTAAAHARLDATLHSVDLRNASQYRRFLEAHAEALLPLEATLVNSGVRRLFPDWDQRARSRALVEDIVQLGGAVRSCELLKPFNDAGVLGAMYVLEGSRLGAAIQLGIVAQSADPVVRNATEYLGHGAQQRLWPSFLAMLGRHGASLDDVTGVVSAARQAFALFEAALSRLVVPAAATIAASDRP